MTNIDPTTTTIAELLVGLAEMGAGIAKFTGENAAGEPVFSIIVVRGDGTPEILRAVEAGEARWEKDGAAKREEQPGFRLSPE